MPKTRRNNDINKIQPRSKKYLQKKKDLKICNKSIKFQSEKNYFFAIFQTIISLSEGMHKSCKFCSSNALASTTKPFSKRARSFLKPEI